MQKKPLILVAVILVLVIVLAFVWQKKQAVSQQVDKGQDVSPSIQTVSQEGRYPQHITEIPGTNNVWYAIPEIGIRFIMSKEMAEDLIYSYRGNIGSGAGYVSVVPKDDDTVDFSSKILLSQFGETCKPESGAIGALSRRSNEEMKGFGEIPGVVKRFKDSVVIYGGAQAPCVVSKDRMELFRKIYEGEKGVSRLSRYFHSLDSQDFINSLELTK